MWRNVRSVLQACQIGMLLWILFMIFVAGNTHLDMFWSIMIFMSLIIINVLIFAYVEVIEILSTLATVTEYAFGKDADPDECLEKLAEWGKKQGLDIRILKD